MDIVQNNSEGQAHFRELVALRVRKYAQQRGLNASRLGKALGISRATMSNYWNGKKMWPLEILPFLASTLETSFDDILTLEGTMSQHLPINHLSSLQSHVPIREIDLKFGFGSTYLDIPVTEERHNFSKGWVRQYTHAKPENLFFAQGVGDSMEPTLYDSDLLLIDSSQGQLNMADKLWAIAYSDIGMIKRLRPAASGKVDICSDNQALSTITADSEEVRVIGRVVAVQRKL